MFLTSHKPEMALAKRMIRFRARQSKRVVYTNYNSTESLVDKVIQHAINHDNTKSLAWVTTFSLWLGKQMNRPGSSLFCEEWMLKLAPNRVSDVYGMLVDSYNTIINRKIDGGSHVSL